MKTRKNYKLVVLFLSLFTLFFASCSNSVVMEEQQKVKINFVFEDEYFQNIFGTNSNSRMVTAPEQNLIEYLTITNSQTNKVVYSGSIALCPAIPVDQYNFDIDIFYFTDSEIEEFQNEVIDYFTMTNEGDAGEGTSGGAVGDGASGGSVGASGDSMGVIEEPAGDSQIYEVYYQFVYNSIKTNNKIPVYFSNMTNQLVNRDNDIIPVHLQKNPEYTNTVSTLEYSFAFDENRVMKEADIPIVTARLYKLDDYLNNKDNDPIKTFTPDLEGDGEFYSTTDSGKIDLDEINKRNDISLNKIWTIKIDNLDEGLYVMELTFALALTEESYTTMEVLKIENGFDYKCIYHGDQIQSQKRGFVNLEINQIATAYSNETSSGIIMTAKKIESLPFVRFVVIDSENTIVSDKISKFYWYDNERTCYFFEPVKDQEYSCSVYYYYDDPRDEIGEIKEDAESNYYVDLGAVVAESSIHTTMQKEAIAVYRVEDTSGRLEIIGFDTTEFIWTKMKKMNESLGIDYSIDQCGQIYSFNINYRDEKNEWQSEEFYGSGDVGIDYDNIRLSISESGITRLKDLKDKDCYLTCKYSFYIDNIQYSVDLFTLEDNVTINFDELKLLLSITMSWDEGNKAVKLSYENPDETKFTISDIILTGDDCTFRKYMPVKQNDYLEYPVKTSNVHAEISYQINDIYAKIISKDFIVVDSSEMMNSSELSFVGNTNVGISSELLEVTEDNDSNDILVHIEMKDFDDNSFNFEKFDNFYELLNDDTFPIKGNGVYPDFRINLEQEQLYDGNDSFSCIYEIQITHAKNDEDIFDSQASLKDLIGAEMLAILDPSFKVGTYKLELSNYYKLTENSNVNDTITNCNLLGVDFILKIMESDSFYFNFDTE